MGTFALECPHCKRYVTAHNGLRGLIQNKIECQNCHNEIDVKAERMTTCKCPSCGNMVLYDQGKKSPTCPVCGKKIAAGEGQKMVNFNCPGCGVSFTATEGTSVYTCPLCDTVIDVQREVLKNQRRGLVDLIRYEGDNNTLVYKFPVEDFPAGAQLYVHESQEAVFFQGGQALQTYTSYGSPFTLNTIGMPGAEELYKLPTGDTRRTFHSEVYFVNMTQTPIAKWGTPEKVRILDPVVNITSDVGCSGTFNLRVVDSRKLLMTLIGTTNGLILTEKDLDSDRPQASLKTNPFDQFFRPLIVDRVKSYLSTRIIEKGVNILYIGQYAREFGQELKDEINEWLESEYGLTLPNFTITRFMTSADDPNDPNYKAWQDYQRNQQLASIGTQKETAEAAVARARQERELIQAQTEAQKRIIEAQGEAGARKAQVDVDIYRMQGMGYTYQDETQRQVSLAGMKALENGMSSGGGTGSGGGGGSDAAGMMGSLAATGIALGAMGGIANTFMDTVGGVMQKGSQAGASMMNQNGQNSKETQRKWQAPEAKQPEAETWDCPNCGTKGLSLDWGFCPKCRAEQPKPEPEAETWDCPNCGTKGLSLDWGFCPKCRAEQPKPGPATWDCPNCGTKGLSLEWGFCPKCRAEQPKPGPATWDCPFCGTKGLSMDWNFCPKCQHERGDEPK